MAKKGVPLSEEHKRKLSEVRKGRPSSFAGKHHTVETKKKLSDMNKGKCPTVISYGMLGKHHTEETKRKMSQAHMGKILSAEHKKKMGEGHKGLKCGMWGKHHTEETKNKLRKLRGYKGGKTTQTLRKIVLIRDNYTCQICGLRD